MRDKESCVFSLMWLFSFLADLSLPLSYNTYRRWHLWQGGTSFFEETFNILCKIKQIVRFTPPYRILIYINLIGSAFYPAHGVSVHAAKNMSEVFRNISDIFWIISEIIFFICGRGFHTRVSKRKRELTIVSFTHLPRLCCHTKTLFRHSESWILKEGFFP